MITSIIILVPLAILAALLGIAEFVVANGRVKRWALENGLTILKRSPWPEWVDGSRKGMIAFGRRKVSTSARSHLLAKSAQGEMWIISLSVGGLFSALSGRPVQVFDRKPYTESGKE